MTNFVNQNFACQVGRNWIWLKNPESLLLFWMKKKATSEMAENNNNE